MNASAEKLKRIDSTIAAWMILQILKLPSSQKCVFLAVATVECLRFTLQDDVCAELDIGKMFLHLLIKVYIFSVLIDDNILRGGAYKYNSGSIISMLKYDVDTWLT